MQLVCPNCGSSEITFGRAHRTYFYWTQSKDIPVGANLRNWSEDYIEGYERAAHELTDYPIACWCNGCDWDWEDWEHRLEDYFDA
jgi:hypothetical protein